MILWRFRFKKWKAEEVNIPLAGIGSIKLRPDEEVIRIAHQAWTELVTRKAGLPFDEEHDVIVEIYNSWYELFRTLRALAKTISPTDIRQSKDAHKLLDTLIIVLNQGLRPNLTKWQAKFRRWYDHESERNPNKSPQEIQRLYPKYKDMIEDLKNVNNQLVQLTSALKIIAHGQKGDGMK